MLVDEPESFLRRHIKGLRDIHMQSFDKMSPLVKEEKRQQEKYKMADGGHICRRTGIKFGRAQ